MTNAHLGHATREGVLRFAYWIAALLLLGNLAFIVEPRLAHDEDFVGELAYRVAKETDLGREGNVATWFTSALLLTGALWAYQLRHSVPRSRPRARAAWLLVAAGLCLLSADDIAEIHEKVESSFRDLTDRYDIESGVVGAGFGTLLAVLLVLIVRFGLWEHIGKRTSRLLVGAVLCIVVAVAAELGETALDCRSRSTCSRIEVVLEEGGELVAILLFLQFQTGILNRRETAVGPRGLPAQSPAGSP